MSGCRKSMREGIWRLEKSWQTSSLRQLLGCNEAQRSRGWVVMSLLDQSVDSRNHSRGEAIVKYRLQLLFLWLTVSLLSNSGVGREESGGAQAENEDMLASVPNCIGYGFSFSSDMWRVPSNFLSNAFLSQLPQ